MGIWSIKFVGMSIVNKFVLGKVLMKFKHEQQSNPGQEKDMFSGSIFILCTIEKPEKIKD